LSLILNYRTVLFLVTALTVFFMPDEFSGIKTLMTRKDPVPLIVGIIMILLLLPYCAALIVGGSSSPFIYFRF
jgi:hypothetical protein